MNRSLLRSAPMLPIMLLALAAHPSPPVLAQVSQPPPASAGTVDASLHEQIYTVMEAGIDQQQIVDTIVEQTTLQMVGGNSALAAIEAEYPSFMRTMGDAMRPVIYDYSERVRLTYRPQMVAAMREVLSDAEAGSVLAFYQSDLGQRVMRANSSNFSADNSVRDVISGQQVAESSVMADSLESGRNVMNALSAEDRQKVMRLSIVDPGLRKMPQVLARISPIRTAMEMEPPTPEELERLGEAVDAAATAAGMN